MLTNNELEHLAKVADDCQQDPLLHVDLRKAYLDLHIALLSIKILQTEGVTYMPSSEPRDDTRKPR
jgi:hypothetical protein